MESLVGECAWAGGWAWTAWRSGGGLRSRGHGFPQGTRSARCPSAMLGEHTGPALTGLLAFPVPVSWGLPREGPGFVEPASLGLAYPCGREGKQVFPKRLTTGPTRPSFWRCPRLGLTSAPSAPRPGSPGASKGL